MPLQQPSKAPIPILCEQWLRSLEQGNILSISLRDQNQSNLASFKIFINYCGAAWSLCFFSNKLPFKHLYLSLLCFFLQGCLFIFMGEQKCVKFFTYSSMPAHCKHSQIPWWLDVYSPIYCTPPFNKQARQRMEQFCLCTSCCWVTAMGGEAAPSLTLCRHISAACPEIEILRCL